MACSRASTASAYSARRRWGEAQGPMGVSTARVVANDLSQRINGFFELLVLGMLQAQLQLRFDKVRLHSHSLAQSQQSFFMPPHSGVGKA